MARRTKGPKRRAERYYRALGIRGDYAAVTAAAYMAGYRSAARARKAVNLRVLDHQAKVIEALKNRIAELEHDLNRSMANHVADLNK